jgi:hypothetical protein
VSAVLVIQTWDLPSRVIRAVAVKIAALDFEVLFLTIYTVRLAPFEVPMLRLGAILVLLTDLNLLAGVSHNIRAAVISENVSVNLVFFVPIVISRHEDEKSDFCAVNIDLKFVRPTRWFARRISGRRENTGTHETDTPLGCNFQCIGACIRDVPAIRHALSFHFASEPRHIRTSSCCSVNRKQSCHVRELHAYTGRLICDSLLVAHKRTQLGGIQVTTQRSHLFLQGFVDQHMNHYKV